MYKGLNFVTVIIRVITYCKLYCCLFRFQYIAYTVSPSPWTYPSSGCYSLAVVAMHLLKLCCSLCCSPEYLQHAFFALICKIQEKYFLLHAVIDSPRPDFAFTLLSTGSFAPIVKWSTRPHGLFTLPAALHAWKRTCHFKHCSYVIFTSITDGIRGVSIVKKYCSYMSLSLPANISLRFCKHWYMCKYTAAFIIVIWAYGFLLGYIGWHSWLNIGKKSLLFKRCGKRDQNFFN